MFYQNQRRPYLFLSHERNHRCPIARSKKKLETDPKEINEHNTIVDLIRNDLSKVAKQVQVTPLPLSRQDQNPKKRDLPNQLRDQRQTLPDWKSQLPDILLGMLPAGSICGALKAKTVSIIREVEQGPRGYYTGIFGYFDGENLDSAVNIRYLEKKDGHLLYRSGGGITFLSDLESEYNELIEKDLCTRCLNPFVYKTVNCSTPNGTVCGLKKPTGIATAKQILLISCKASTSRLNFPKA